jgi:hypothetical protein
MQRASKLALIGVAAVAITGAGNGITGAPLDQATELPGCGWQPAPGATRILAGCRSAET